MLKNSPARRAYDARQQHVGVRVACLVHSNFTLNPVSGEVSFFVLFVENMNKAKLFMYIDGVFGESVWRLYLEREREKDFGDALQCVRNVCFVIWMLWFSYSIIFSKYIFFYAADPMLVVGYWIEIRNILCFVNESIDGQIKFRRGWGIEKLTANGSNNIRSFFFKQ